MDLKKSTDFHENKSNKKNQINHSINHIKNAKIVKKNSKILSKLTLGDNKILMGDYLNTSAEYVGDVNNTVEKFSLYLKILKQISSNRVKKTRTISCQHENQRPFAISQSYNRDKNKKGTLSYNLSFFKSPQSTETENIKDFYEKINIFLDNKQTYLSSYSLEKDKKDIESILYRLHNQPNRVKTCKKIMNKKITIRKVRNRAIQVKSETNTKGVDIKPLNDVKIYVNTLTNFISTAVTEDFLQLLNNQVFNEIISEKAKTSVKIQGDCNELSTIRETRFSNILSTTLNSSLNESIINSEGVSRDEKYREQSFFKEKVSNSSPSNLQIQDFMDMMIESIELPNLDGHRRTKSPQTTLELESIVKQCPITNMELTIDNLHLGLEDLFNASKHPCQMYDSLSTISFSNHKYRNKCLTGFCGDFRQISLTECQPIIHNKTPLNDCVPLIFPVGSSEIGKFHDIELNSKLEIKTEKLKPLTKLKNFLSGSKFPVHCNQSQNDRLSQFCMKNLDLLKNDKDFEYEDNIGKDKSKIPSSYIFNILCNELKGHNDIEKEKVLNTDRKYLQIPHNDLLENPNVFFFNSLIFNSMNYFIFQSIELSFCLHYEEESHFATEKLKESYVKCLIIVEFPIIVKEVPSDVCSYSYYIQKNENGFDNILQWDNPKVKKDEPQISSLFVKKYGIKYLYNTLLAKWPFY